MTFQGSICTNGEVRRSDDREEVEEAKAGRPQLGTNPAGDQADRQAPRSRPEVAPADEARIDREFRAALEKSAARKRRAAKAARPPMPAFTGRLGLGGAGGGDWMFGHGRFFVIPSDHNSRT